MDYAEVELERGSKAGVLYDVSFGNPETHRAESNGAKINSVSNSAKSFPILPSCLRGAGDRLQWYVEKNTQF